MNQQCWLQLTLLLSLLLLGTSLSTEALYLNRPYKWTPTLKLPHEPKAADSSFFWEATLTGNSRKISKQTKQELKSLGMAHIYTPSGLHLSLILNPFFFLIKSNWARRIILSLLFILSTIYLPGWAAVKRVIEIKFSQSLLSPLGVESRWSFLIVMFFDLCFGTYHDGSMSFCFSFLFLSILYARLNFFVSAWWFFLAQIIIAIFLEQSFFITNIFITPLLTFLFSLIFPFLLVLRFIPPWHFLGETLSTSYLDIVHFFFQLSIHIPKIEALPILIIMIFLFLFARYRLFILSVFLFSGSLNLGQNRTDASYLARKYFIVNEGRKGCRLEGEFEKCSYRSRSTKDVL